MRRLIIILALTSISASLLAQTSFNIKFGKSGFDEFPTDIVELSNSNILLAYTTSQDYFITKNQKLLILSPTGATLQELSFIDNGNYDIHNLLYYSDSLIVGTGEYKSNDTLFIWYLGFDCNLNIKFDRKYATTATKFTMMRSFIDSGDRINTVISTNPSHGGTLFVKANSQGDTLLTRNKNTPYFSSFNLEFLQHDSYYRLFSNYNSGDPIGVQLLDTNFNFIANHAIPFDVSNAITGKVIDNNSYYLAGRGSLLDPDWNVIIEKLDFQDSIIVQNVVNRPDTNDFAASYNCLDYSDPNRIFLSTFAPIDVETGYSESYNYYYLHLYDSTLNNIWTRKWGGDAYYRINVMIASQDGGVIMTGAVYDYLSQDMLNDIFVMKVDEQGLVTSTIDSDIQNNTCLVFPNPGIDELRIKVMDQYLPLEFNLYNSSGKKVLDQSLVYPENCISTTFLPSGLYLWNLMKNGKMVETGKWIKN